MLDTGIRRKSARVCGDTYTLSRAVMLADLFTVIQDGVGGRLVPRFARPLHGVVRDLCMCAAWPLPNTQRHRCAERLRLAALRFATVC